MARIKYKESIECVNETEKRINEQKIRIISKIVQRRQMLGLTQEEVASRVGLKQSAIARLENSSQMPRLDTLIKVLSTLGLYIELVSKDQQ